MKKILSAFILLLFSSSLLSQNWYMENYSEEIAKDYFVNSYNELDMIEGIWQSSDGFRYSIEKDVERGRRVDGKYRIVVLVGGYREWSLGDIKGFISYGSGDGFYAMTYYTRTIGSGYYAKRTTSSQSILLKLEGNSTATFNYNNNDNGYKQITWLKLFPR